MQTFLSKVNLAVDFARDVAENKNLYEQAPFRAWDPVGDVKGRSFNQRVAMSAKSDHVLAKTVGMIRDMPIEDRFPFVSDAAKSLFSAETIHAMNNVFVVRIRGHKVSMKSADSDTRKEDPTRKPKVGSYEFEASVPISAVLISSDQLVDLCNIHSRDYQAIFDFKEFLCYAGLCQQIIFSEDRRCFGTHIGWVEKSKRILRHCQLHEKQIHLSFLRCL